MDKERGEGAMTGSFEGERGGGAWRGNVEKASEVGVLIGGE